MNKEKITELINKLSDKTLSLGCIIRKEKEKHLKYRTGDREEFGDGYDYAIFYHKNYSGYITSSFRFNDENEIEIIGHPIMIGDVVFRVAEKYRDEEFKEEEYLEEHSFVYSQVPKLLELWYLCGENKSLQEIIKESGYTVYRTEEGEIKDINARSLLVFIDSIFNNL